MPDYPAIISGYVSDAMADLAEKLRASGRVAVGDPFWEDDPETNSVRLAVNTRERVPLETTEENFKAISKALIGKYSAMYDDTAPDDLVKSVVADTMLLMDGSVPLEAFDG